MEISEQQRLNDLLITAVKAGDAEAAISLLQQGADPNAESEVDLYGYGVEMMPPLELALCWFARGEAWNLWLAGGKEERINPPLVKALVDAGADVNAISWGPTPLEIAAREGEREIVECLLEHGADINRKGIEFPLHAAVGSLHVSVVQLLLERGADPNQTLWGLTPLQSLNARAQYQPFDNPAQEAAVIDAVRAAAALAEARLAQDPPGDDQKPARDSKARTEEISRLLKAYGAEE
jgi:hypothetical protein